MSIIEKLQFEKIATNYYSCNLYYKNNEVIISFDNVKLVFQSCLIFKCGYPNEEIYMHYDYYTQGSMTKYCVYEIEDSEWIRELMIMNRVHPRNEDEVIKNERHFIILFEDEVFECICKKYVLV